jgi:hypothetical protein
MTDNKRAEVPHDVVMLLAAVRADGGANMIADIRGVMRIAKRMAHFDKTHAVALHWLMGHMDQYGNALFLMGDMRSAGLIE